MGAMKVMDPKLGDKRVTWDKGKKDEVDVAKREFDFLVQEKGYLAYEVGARGKPGKQIRAFDPALEEVILRPSLVGG